MKRFLLISVFALVFTTANFAQLTVHLGGTVSDASTGLPIVNQPVYVWTDSLALPFFYSDTLYTDSNGQYQDSVIVPSNVWFNFDFYTSYNCGGAATAQSASSSVNNIITINFVLCSAAPPCQAVFGAFPDFIDPTGLSFIFISNFTGGSPLSVSWDYGDGTTSTLQSPPHTYTSAGIYYVCLTIVTANCTSTYCDSLWAGSQPCYNYFTYSNQGLNYSFAGYPANGTPPYTYIWDFGDGTTGTGSNPSHTYTQAGYYVVTLTTSDPNGCTATSTQTIGNYTGCQASFMAYPDTSGLGVFFYDQSLGNPSAWYWSFGDGSTSNLQYPYHAYMNAGTYTVCLVIYGANGCADSTCQVVFVNTPSLCNAQYYYYPDSSLVNTILFQNYSTGNISNYLWDFGDGSTSTLMNPLHVYTLSGNYYVCLTISNNSTGCYDIFCNNVYVGNSVFCQAYFYAVPDSSNPASGAYQFFDASTGSPSAYSWSFGDGTVSTLQDPTHTYTSNGVYSVCLTITSTNCTSTWCDSLYVGPQPCYNYFTYNNMPAMAVSFTGYPFNGVAPYTYTWDFGDGASGTGMSVVHTYVSTGSFIVTLTTVDGNGCSYVSTQYIYVGGNISYLYGQVTANGNWLDYGSISLFVQNPVTNALYLLDNTSIDSSGYYWFNNVYQGTYYILATPAPNSAYYSTYAPTYYQSAIFWAGATPIIIGTAANPYDIALAALLGPSPGNGNISGTITEGAKLFAQGPAVPNIEILLLNMSNQPLSMVYSDAAGEFSFHNLAMGTYKVYAEIAGLPTTPYIVTLTNNTPNSTNVNLLKTPNGITTGLSETPVVTEFSILSVYPNPAKDIVTIAVESAKPAVLTAELFDLTGKRVMMKMININTGKASYKLNINNLQAGFYTLSLTSDKGIKSTQKLTLIP